jgi:hypothetical protein
MTRLRSELANLPVEANKSGAPAGGSKNVAAVSIECPASLAGIMLSACVAVVATAIAIVVDIIKNFMSRLLLRHTTFTNLL